MDRAGWNYPSGDLRVSDADRDRALSELSAAFQAGRITVDELEQRSGQALAARTGKELTTLLSDLPAEPVPAPRTRALTGAQHVLAARIQVAAGIAAICFAASAVAAAVNTGPSLAQREIMKEVLVRQGLPVPPGFLQNPGFDWAGTLTPTAVAVLLVMLIVFLRVRIARADRQSDQRAATSPPGEFRR
jgi:hypothetical protein